MARPTRTEVEERKKAEERGARIPFGTPQLTLTIDKRTEERLKAEDLVPYWFKEDNIKRAIDAWYDFVHYDNVKLGEAEEEADTRIKRVGKDGTALYLMAIPKKYYDQDIEAQEEIDSRVDKAILGGNPTGLEGHGLSPDEGGSYVKNIQYKP